MSRALATAVLLLSCVVLNACGTSSSDDNDSPAGYRPVPDRELYAAIRNLPGYDGGNVSWFDDLNRRGYIGRLGWAEDSDETPREATEMVIRILRHGRYDAYISFTMVKPGTAGADSLDVADGAEELRRRFGAQTGQAGWPPTFVTE